MLGNFFTTNYYRKIYAWRALVLVLEWLLAELEDPGSLLNLQMGFFLALGITVQGKKLRTWKYKIVCRSTQLELKENFTWAAWGNNRLHKIYSGSKKWMKIP